MEKVRPWYDQPSDRGRLRNRTDDDAMFTTMGHYGAWIIRRILKSDSPGGSTGGRSVMFTIALL